jgi:LysM repeat protein/ABC-type branched-subunit amino acid transport system substrate-binding protein
LGEQPQLFYLFKQEKMGNLIQLRRFIVILFCLVAAVHSLQAQQLPYEIVTIDGQSYYKYKVQPGEGLYAVSRTFSVSVAEIIRHNPGSNNGLQNGQELLIPISKEVESTVSAKARQVDSRQDPADQNNTFKHTVVKGETVYSISRMYHTTVDQIIQLNPEAAEGISVGSVLTIPQRRVISREKEENYRYHTILPKETLYSVSKTYRLKPEDVILANPGLSVETFQIGKTIRIPFFESYEVVEPLEEQTTNIIHTVVRGETLYGIAGKYGVEVSQLEEMNPMLSGGLKPNMELIVPVPRSRVENVSRSEQEQANRLLLQRHATQPVDVMRVGLLLPFLDQTSRGHLRLQEYYEGFLLAVNDLKNRGANLELYVFEIGKGNDTRKLESLLETLEMQSLNLVIGGVTDAQIKVLSDFSRSNNIKYVVPFSQSNAEVLNNGSMFQVNPMNSLIHTKTVAYFTEKFRNANIIFVGGGSHPQQEFISLLQASLKQQNISYGSVESPLEMAATIAPMLRQGQENLMLPVSSDATTLRQIIAELKKLHESNPGIVTTLFGHPDWQTYSDLSDELAQFGTYFYTPFFVDKQSRDTEIFLDKFRKWYGRDLLETYPSYGMWGYDTALFFLTALQRYGLHFEQQINSVNVSSIQFPFHFERLNNWGGLINGALYIIHYDRDGRIQKTKLSR